MQFFIFLYFFLSFVKLNSDASIHFTYVAKNHFKLKIFLFPSLSSSPPRNRPIITCHNATMKLCHYYNMPQWHHATMPPCSPMLVGSYW